MKSKYLLKSRFIALDIDGTICGRGEPPSEKVICSIKTAVKKGWKFILCTGRRYERVSPLIKILGIPGCHVVSDGAEIFDKDGNILYSNNISSEKSLEILRLASDFKITVVFAEGNRLITDKYNDDIEYILSYGDPCPEFAGKDLYQQINGKTFPLIYLIQSSIDSNINLLIKRINEIKGIHAQSSSPGYVCIVSEGVSKGKSLEIILKHNSFSHRPFIVAIGDGENDISMFNIADLSVAMGNANRMVKSFANIQAPTLSDDGVAYIIDKLVDESLV